MTYEVLLHQLSDQAVVGVNWRPMRLIGEVSRENVSERCSEIPREMALLPRKHALCHLCREATTSAGEIVCLILRTVMRKRRTPDDTASSNHIERLE
ncbi:hypothetical protein MTO96_050261, partial [Rhipicephalus appendiculatus]